MKKSRLISRLSETTDNLNQDDSEMLINLNLEKITGQCKYLSDKWSPAMT